MQRLSTLRTIAAGAAAGAVALTIGAAPALAQQSLTLGYGQFSPKDVDSRIDRDVVLTNLDLFAIRVGDFDGRSLTGSWNVGLGDHLEASFGLGFYQRTVPSVYADYLNENGSEIAQDFRLRIVPATATVRVLPFGRSAVQPFFGVGVGLYAWRYAEFGEFIDFYDFSVFSDRFVATGTDPGGIILGGIRVPMGDAWSIGVELQYHQASGVVGLENGFLEDELDLGGLTSQVTFGVQF